MVSGDGGDHAAYVAACELVRNRVSNCCAIQDLSRGVGKNPADDVVVVLTIDGQAHPVVEVLCLDLFEDAEPLVTFQRVDSAGARVEVRLDHFVLSFDENPKHPKKNHVKERDPDARREDDLVRQHRDVSDCVEVAPVLQRVDLNQRVHI